MTVTTGIENLPPPQSRPVVGHPRTGSRRLGRTAKYALLVFFLVVVLMPVYVLMVTSLKPPAGRQPGASWGLPVRWPWEPVVEAGRPASTTGPSPGMPWARRS